MRRAGMGLLRGTGRAVAGTARVAGRAATGLGGALAVSTGFAPAIAVTSRLFRSRRGGRRGGRGRGSSQKGTGLLNSSVLFQIRDEVQQIKGLLVNQEIPESERREKEFDDQRRHKELLRAILGLGSGMLGGMGAAGKTSLATLLTGLLAITGLAMLPKLLENLPSLIDGIQNFLDKMGLFLLGMWGAFKILGKRTRAMRPPPRPTPTRSTGSRQTRVRGERGRSTRIRPQNRAVWRPSTRSTQTVARGERGRGGAIRPQNQRVWQRASTSSNQTRVGGERGRTTALRPQNTQASLTRATSANASSIKSTENRLNTNIGKVRTTANNAWTQSVTNSTRIGEQGRNIKALETRVVINEKTTAAARGVEERGNRFASDRSTTRMRPFNTGGPVRAPGEGLRRTGSGINPTAYGKGWDRIFGKTGPMAGGPEARTTKVGFGGRPGTSTPFRPSHSLRTPFVQRNIGHTPTVSTAGQKPPISTSRPPVVGTTIVNGRIVDVVKSAAGNLMNAGADGKATTVAPKFIMEGGNIAQGRNRPLPTAAPAVLGGGDNGRNPAATPYESPWQRFLRSLNKHSSKLSRRGRDMLAKVKEGLKQRYFGAKGAIGQAMNFTGARFLGTMGLAVILIMSYAETVALRIEGKLDSDAFWAQIAGITAVLAPLLLAFGVLTTLVAVVLGIVAPFLGATALFVGSVIGATFITNWVLKRLGIQDTGPSGDPWTERWGKRGQHLSREGRKMMAEEFSKGGTLLSKLAGGFIANAGDAIRLTTWIADAGTSVLQKAPTAINTMFDVEGPDRFARQQGYADYAAYKKDKQFEKYAHRRERRRSGANTEYRSPLDNKKKVVPSYKLGATMADDPLSPGSSPGSSGGSRIHTQGLDLERLRIIMQKTDSPDVVVVSTQSRIDASQITTTVNKQSAQTIFPGHNISLNDSATGLYP